jgi:hypothetical protein
MGFLRSFPRASTPALSVAFVMCVASLAVPQIGATGGERVVDCNGEQRTEAQIAASRGLSLAQLRLLGMRRSLTPERVCQVADAVLARQLDKAAEPARQDQPDEALRYRLLDLRDETGRVLPDGLMIARRQVDRMRADSRSRFGDPSVAGITPGTWTWLGPGNVGGRLRSILIHPTMTTTMWVGSVGGGMWKTTNGGTSWSPVNDFMANLAVTTLVMDPTNANVIYAGTGEGFFNTDAIQGAGVFKSTDGGTNWAQLANTANSSFNFVNRLSIAPGGGAILAATNSGIFRSTDGGANWTSVHATRTLDVDFDPTDASRAIAGRSDGTALFSTNGGVTWTAAPSLGANRVEVAYAPSSPNITYASVYFSSGQLWRSTDGGATYTLMNTGTNYLGAQGWYDNALWVSPTDPAFVIVGGIDLFKSVDSGTTLTQISNWALGGSYGPSAHADHHAIVAHPGFDGSSNKTVFFGNDGGIYRATDVTTVGNNPPNLTAGWTELNNNLGVTQFYGAAGTSSNGRIVGGTQDNGTPVYFGGTESWADMFGGDGGWSAADQTDPNYLYGEYTFLGIHRSSNGGTSSSYISGRFWNGSAWVYKAAPFKIDDAELGRANFIAPFILDPNNQQRLLGGGWSLWRTNDARTANTTTSGPTWAAIKPPTTGNSPISAIAVAPGNSDIIWVGHNNGDVYRTTNGTAGAPTWVLRDNTTPALPARKVTRIAIDPTNSNVVYVTFGGFSADNVYKTTNAGDTWVDRTGSGGTGLPNAPIRTLAIHPDNSQWIYAGGESGIFASEDGGATWNLPHDAPANVSVDELFIMQNANRDLVAATHGRGIYRHPTTPGGVTATLAFTSTGSAVAETGSATLTVSVTTSDGNPTTGQVSVNYSTFNGSALSAQDFTSATGLLTFAAGTASGASQNFTVTILTDTKDEFDETFSVTLSNPLGPGAFVGQSAHTVTITDDDAPPNLSIADVTVEEPFAGTANAVFAVSLSAVSGKTVSVGYATANNTAIANVSSSPHSNPAAITIGSATTPQAASPFPSNITVPSLPGIVSNVSVTLNNFAHTWPQDVDILLVGPGGQKLLLMSDVGGSTPVVGATLTFDSSALPLTSAALASGTYRPTNLSDGEGGDTFSSPAPASPYSSGLGIFNQISPAGTWSLYVMDDTAVDSGSIAGWSLTFELTTGDYIPKVGGILTINPGSTTGVIQVPVIGDGITETVETFFVDLSGPSNAGITDGHAIGTINDNVAPAISISDVTVTEGASGSTNAIFNVTLSASSSSTVTVLASTASNTASAPSDYAARTNVLITFPPGVTSQPFSVGVQGDLIDELNETFFANLTFATNATILDPQGVGTITDDDTSSIQITDVTVTETNTGTVNAVFTLSMTRTNSQTVQVLATLAGVTAAAGVDFQNFAPATISFGPGVAVRTYAVPVIGDLIDEPTETFALNLSSAVNAVIGDAQGVATILDNDTSTIAITDVTVTEGNTGTVNAVFSVTLSNPNSQIVQVTAASAAGTATSGVDFLAMGPSVVVFNPGVTTRSFEVPVIGELVPESVETFVVNLFAASNAVIGDAQGIGTILDNDAPTLSVADASVAEGNSGSANLVFTVTLSAASASTVTASASTAGGSATSGVDFTATGPTTLTFAPGITTRTFSVPIVGDNVAESNETFLVNLASPTNATILDGVGVGTINNDDPLPAARVFVAVTGSDAGDCATQTTPCRNLAAALAQVAADGEIIVLSTGEYDTAPLLIGKGVKITSPSGTVALVRQPITINASGGRVVLRGLDLKGTGTGDGITVIAADGVSIEDTSFDRWTIGLRLNAGLVSQVSVVNSVFRFNGTGMKDMGSSTMNRASISGSRFEANVVGLETLGGVHTVSDTAFIGPAIAGITAFSSSVDIRRSEFWKTGPGAAVAAFTGAVIRVSRSHIFGNGVGLDAAGGGSIVSSGTNVIRRNGTNTLGTISLLPEQ